MRPTVVWDVDDVLNDLMAAWLARVWASEHPGRPIELADVRANPPHELLGIERAAYHASLDAFKNGAGYAALAPNPRISAGSKRTGNAAITWR